MKNCVTCGQPVPELTTCDLCDKPVHLKEPDCGEWLLDSWQVDPDEGNTFWCKKCLEKTGDEPPYTRADAEADAANAAYWDQVARERV